VSGEARAGSVRHLPRFLLVLLLAYAAASLAHHVHNAEFLADYPNMPAWLTRGQVYLAWLAVTAIGLIGYALFRRGFHFAGLVLIALYAAMGFDGLGHYSLAPVSAHTAAMNLTIGLEVATGALLCFAVAMRLAKR
jgi:hypothetical protein